MKHIVCNICSGSSYHPVFSLRDWSLGLPGDFQLVRCDTCGFLYLNPQPEWGELQLHYPQEYLPHRLSSDTGFSKTIQQAGVHRRVQLVRRFASEGRLLEVGSGTGQFLASMQKAGSWDCQGVELVEAAAETTRRLAGVPVFCGTLSEARFDNNSFDVVTLWYVLEHVPTPLQDLQEIYRILKPGGLVFICTPNTEAPLARLFGSCWASYDSPRHLGLFPRKLLESTLDNIGFTRRGLYFISSEFLDFFTSLANCFIKHGHITASTLCRRTVQSTLLRVITAPLFFLPATMGLSSSPVYIACKRG